MSELIWQRIVDLLEAKGALGEEKLREVLKSPRAKGRTLGEILEREEGIKLGGLLVEEGLINRQELLSVLAKSLKLTPIHLTRLKPDASLTTLVPQRLALEHRLVPISKIGKTLTVAMADPLNVLALDDLAQSTDFKISPVLASEEEIEKAIRNLYQAPVEQSVEALAKSFEAEAAEEEGVEGEEGLEEEEVVDLSAFGMSLKKAPVVKVVDTMITEALRSRASDIHVEPYESSVRVRYRVDGALVEAFRLPKKFQNALITRLKILAKLDITENRLPQDGRIKVRAESREVDLRISALPISFGNKVVMRILDKSNLTLSLEKIGFLPESLAAFKKATSFPYGMILVTGPTGSGKSTTLYSVLNQLNEPGRNILTVEDPVEYQLDGITQVQVNPEIGLTFAKALRAFLRQAPDVVLVGEIRDAETADIAIKASLTGQIVLSTLHTNDAPSAVARLIDMGVDPFLLASSLVFVAAQRLCREICPRCKAPDSIPEEKLKKLGIDLPKGQILFKGKGCPHCLNTGFRGRFAILEALLVDDPIREMIVGSRPPDEIKAYAISKGMRTLRQEGLVHAFAGRTSLSEVLRVT